MFYCSVPGLLLAKACTDPLAGSAGPNMVGKSTVLRTLCAVNLLASCGLFAPVEHAEFPFTDVIMLRNLSQDSPTNAQSAFATEMHEMKYVPFGLIANADYTRGFVCGLFYHSILP